MNAADAQRLSEIKQHRLLLPAVELDDPLVRFTEVKHRRALERNLALVSHRSVNVDAADVNDGVNPTRVRLDTVTQQVVNLNTEKVGEKARRLHAYTVDKEVRFLVNDKDTEHRIRAIDFKIHLGYIATREGVPTLPGLLRPELWSRPSFELRMERQSGRTPRPDTIPPDEPLGQDAIFMRYIVPHPIENPRAQVRHLRGILSAGVRLHGLMVTPIKLTSTPRLIRNDAPPRSPELLEGKEQYAIELDSLRTITDDAPTLEDVG